MRVDWLEIGEAFGRGYPAINRNTEQARCLKELDSTNIRGFEGGGRWIMRRAQCGRVLSNSGEMIQPDVLAQWHLSTVNGMLVDRPRVTSRL